MKISLGLLPWVAKMRCVIEYQAEHHHTNKCSTGPRYDHIEVIEGDAFDKVMVGFCIGNHAVSIVLHARFG